MKQKAVFESRGSQGPVAGILLADLQQYPCRCDECGGIVVLAIEGKREYVCSNCGLVQEGYFELYFDLDESQLADLTPRLIPMPPKCICGNRKYTITYEKRRVIGSDSPIHVRIVAQCTRNPKCGYKRYYYPGSSQWTDVHQGYRTTGHRSPKFTRKLPHVSKAKQAAGAVGAAEPPSAVVHHSPTVMQPDESATEILVKRVDEI